MAKPDPVPTFIEVGALGRPAEVDEAVPEKLEEGDWVDEFLGDREIRPNTKKAYLRQLRGFQSWCEFKH